MAQYRVSQKVLPLKITKFDYCIKPTMNFVFISFVDGLNIFEDDKMFISLLERYQITH